MELAEKASQADRDGGATMSRIYWAALRSQLEAAAAEISCNTAMRQILELASKTDFKFPPLKAILIDHPRLGPLTDRLGAQQYGLRVAESLITAAINQIPVLNAATKDSGRYSFNCTNGCGECGVKLREFENYRSETLDGRLLKRRTVPDLVSTCCGSLVEVWDSATEDVSGQVEVILPTDRQPPSVNAEQQTVAWEVVEHGTTSLMTLEQFQSRSFETAVMRPLVYGDTPARAPLSKLDAEDLQIGQQIRRGAMEMPVGYQFEVNVERDAGTVTLLDPDLERIEFTYHGDGLAGEIAMAIDTAINHAKAA